MTELFGMANVPNAVWIDEQGRIVRPAENAGAVDTRPDRETLARRPEDAVAWEASRTRYMEAIGDWVRTGRHGLPEDEVRRRQEPVSEAAAEAAAHHRLGSLLMRRGEEAAALRRLGEAGRLDPDRMTYRRDAWALDNEKIDGRTAMSAQGRHAKDYWAVIDGLQGRPFYPQPELEP